ncbi:hypothetical protein ACMAZE_16120 [Pseudopelagicola sp. nBUS_20]|uniref:hypothetical protein n=1 Tax=Pseudopelagicola sp. nBUS_20 TaxID=3395317 RepID=UPI003EBB617A
MNIDLAALLTLSLLRIGQRFGGNGFDILGPELSRLTVHSEGSKLHANRLKRA